GAQEVGVGGAEAGGVAEGEDEACGQGARFALDAAFAFGSGADVVEIRRGGKVAAKVEVDEVLVGLIGAGFEVGTVAGGLVPEDLDVAGQPEGPGIADFGAGEFADHFGSGEREGADSEQLFEFGLADAVDARDHGGYDASAGFEEDGLADLVD